ncbi:MAG: haloalkane dehalogenase [Deltaproteobacteria bacterium]|nr:haloalkane dehalogenase [Deltaproteobacteria bacterium]
MKNQNRKILRTPDRCFENLPGYPFTPHYLECDGLRIHYVEEGPCNAAPILLMHGEPTWSYLYRSMIPILAKAGLRVIAPDLVGFGRSDKFAQEQDYSYAHQVAVFTEFVRKLDLFNITLFCQDWGGLIGLRVVANEPNRFARIIVANTSLPDANTIMARINPVLLRMMVRLQGKVSLDEIGKHATRYSLRPFIRWVAYSKTSEDFPVGDIIQKGTVRTLPSKVLAAYEAPFPDESYKVGIRRMPSLVPTQLKENRKVWKEIFSHWNKPFLTAFSDSDLITRGIEKIFQSRIPGARNQNHVTIQQAGHFLQEDKGELLAQVILNWIPRPHYGFNN